MNRRHLLQVIAELTATGPVTDGIAAAEAARPALALGQLGLVLGPGPSAQTSHFLQWAGQFLSRSSRNVVFSSVLDRPWRPRQRMEAVGDGSRFVEEAAFAVGFALGFHDSPRVILQGIGTSRVAEAFESVSWLQSDRTGGCAGVVLDGWSMVQVNRMADDASLRAVNLLEAASQAQVYARVMGLPVIMGVRTAAEGAVRAESAWVERALVSLQMPRS